jgi:hypothetical protein
MGLVRHRTSVIAPAAEACDAHIPDTLRVTISVVVLLLPQSHVRLRYRAGERQQPPQQGWLTLGVSPWATVAIATLLLRLRLRLLLHGSKNASTWRGGEGPPGLSTRVCVVVGATLPCSGMIPCVKPLVSNPFSSNFLRRQRELRSVLHGLVAVPRAEFFVSGKSRAVW